MSFIKNITNKITNENNYSSLITKKSLTYDQLKELYLSFNFMSLTNKQKYH